MSKNNFAFIDIQNIHMWISQMGWSIDWWKFRKYLREKYNITKAFLFVGYRPDLAEFYASMQSHGYILIFKDIVELKSGKIKWNVDVDLTLWAVKEMKNYDEALIMSADGDFASLEKYLLSENKLLGIMFPTIRKCSQLLPKLAKWKIIEIAPLRNKIEYRKTP